MLLRLCPSGAALVPYKHAAVGQQARYIGRAFDAKVGGWPATKEPEVIDTDKARRELVTKIGKRAKSRDLLPADEATAAALGVEYVPLRWEAGVWVETPKDQHKKRASAGGND